MVFDYHGRLVIFDSVGSTLKNTPGTTNTLLTMFSYYKSYLAYYAIPYVSQTMYIWGGIASIMSAFNLARYLDRGQSIVRAYILNNRTIVRLEMGRGQILDIPISGLNYKAYNKLGGVLAVGANGKSL